VSSSDLTPNQAKAARLLAEGMSKNAVAAECEVERLQIWRWENQNPAFVLYLQDLLDEADRNTRQKIRDIGNTAIITLEDVMTSPRSSDSAKVSAAKTVLEFILNKTPRLEVPIDLREESNVPEHKELVAKVRKAGREAYLGIVEEDAK
jgi:hypothetical protein